MSEHRSLRDAVWARAWSGDLDSSRLLVLLRLVEHFPRIFPGEKTLAQWTRLSVSTVRRALRDLESQKFIRTLVTPGRVNQYQFLDSSGNPILMDLGPTPVMVTAPPVMVTAPTPVMVTAEADPDLKQLRKAGGGTDRKERLRAMPEPFVPDHTCLALATERGVSLYAELPQFRDHHLKVGSRFSDWQAALRTWIRRSKPSAHPAKPRGRTVEEAMRDFK